MTPPPSTDSAVAYTAGWSLIVAAVCGLVGFLYLLWRGRRCRHELDLVADEVTCLRCGRVFPDEPMAQRKYCDHSAQSWYMKDGRHGCDDCDEIPDIHGGNS